MIRQWFSRWGKPKHDVIILGLMAHGKSRSSGAGCFYFWRFTCSLVSPPPCPPTTQLIQAQEGVEEVPQARAGASLPPPSLFFIWQVNNLNFKPTSAGEQGCTFSFFDSSLWIRTEFFDAAAKNYLNIVFTFSSLYSWVGTIVWGQQCRSKNWVLGKEGQGSSFGLLFQPTIHLPQVLLEYRGKSCCFSASLDKSTVKNCL